MATEFLKEGGVFVTKVFRSGEYNKLLWVFNHLFKKVTPTKPQSSRNVSAEIFVVCEGFIAPKKIDPKLLDPKFVLKTVDSGTFIKSIFAKKESKHRTGYEDGVGAVLFKQGTVRGLVDAADPVEFLGRFNQLVFDEQSKPYESLSITTDEIKACLEDLKVLNKKDFTNILKWRSRIRTMEAEGKEDSDVEEEEAPKELTKEEEEALMLDQMTKELTELERDKKKKRKKRKEEIMKQKKRMVFSKDMADINDQMDDEALFNLKAVNSQSAISSQKDLEELGEEEDSEEQSGSDEEEDYIDLDEKERRYQLELESYFDKMYTQYLYKSKKNKKKALSIMNDEHKQDQEEYSIDEDYPSSEEEVEDDPEKLVVRPVEEAKLKTSMWFDQDEFKDLIDDDADEKVEMTKRLALIKPKKQKVKEIIEDSVDSMDSDEKFDDAVVMGTLTKKKKRDRHKKEAEKVKKKSEFEIVEAPVFPDVDASGSDSEDSFEVVENEAYSDSDSDSYDSSDKAEILAIAKKLKDKTKRKELLDSELHKRQYGDIASLPKWFAEEEKYHNYFNAPITKEEVQVMKDKLKEINARDPKKVAEAKARKKMRLVKNLEKAKSKASKIMESEEIPDASKIKEIERLYSKARSKNKVTKKYVVTKKVQKGKPNFVKAKGNSTIKNVDPRMKKDRRSVVANEKKSKKRKRK